jgi:hypothetical protein
LKPTFSRKEAGHNRLPSAPQVYFRAKAGQV